MTDGQLTLRVLVVQRPFRQLRSTSNLSQYTVFHGLVSLISLVKAPGPGLVALTNFFSSSESLNEPSALSFFEIASLIAWPAALLIPCVELEDDDGPAVEVWTTAIGSQVL